MRGRAAIRSVLAAIVLVAAIGVLETTAHAASPPIAQVSAGTPLSGGEGWLVWSAPTPGGYALMGYHGGKVETLPVAVRQQPFDASVGTGASGAPVVVFSRCAVSPRVAGTGGQTLGSGPTSPQGGELVEPLSGRGCRIHLLPLGGGSEEALPIPVARGVSDTTPSIWRGVVTFGRHAPAHAKVMQVLSWSPRAPRKLLTLPHGVIPECRHAGPICSEPPVQGEVEALASDASAVAFVWQGNGGAIGIDGDTELRIDRANGRGATTAGGSIGGEACTGASAGEHKLERTRFEPPFVSGASVSFGELDTFGCFTGYAGLLVTHGVGPGYSRSGKFTGVIPLAVAGDEGRLYGLLAPLSEGAESTLSWTVTDGPYCSPASPCAIEPLAAPALKREPRLPFEPISFYRSLG